MRISIQDNPLKPGTKRLVLHTGTRANFEDFLKFVEAGSTVSKADALAVTTLQRRWIEICSGQGMEADLGEIGRSRLAMKAKFNKSPERIEDADIELTINWVLPAKLKQLVAREGNKMIRERIAPLPKAPSLSEARRILPDAQADQVLNRYRAGEPMRITGHRLNYDTGRTDEGLFLVAQDGSVRRMEQVISIRPSEILFIMPEDSQGSYHLQVHRRHLSDGPVLTGQLGKPIKSAPD